MNIDAILWMHYLFFAPFILCYWRRITHHSAFCILPIWQKFVWNVELVALNSLNNENLLYSIRFSWKFSIWRTHSTRNLKPKIWPIEIRILKSNAPKALVFGKDMSSFNYFDLAKTSPFAFPPAVPTAAGRVVTRFEEFISESHYYFYFE